MPGHWAIDPDVAFFCGATGVRGLGVELIDLGGVVGDPSSPRTRIESMPRCGGGSPVVLRTKVIHVTLDGAERIGERIASLLDPSVAPPPRDCAGAAAGASVELFRIDDLRFMESQFQ